MGLGSYNMDSHNVRRFVKADGFVQNEGDVQVPVKPYQIAYRVLTPKREEATNLLVPVCFSASHIAYSSMRMEPQYMIIGQHHFALLFIFHLSVFQFLSLFLHQAYYKPYNSR